MLSVLSDTYFMDQAIKEAEKAAHLDEVPVGAVIVCEGSIIARAHNQSEKLLDATAHAELLAITAASGHLGAKWLSQCTLFVRWNPVSCVPELCTGRELVDWCMEPVMTKGALCGMENPCYIHLPKWNTVSKMKNANSSCSIFLRVKGFEVLALRQH